jgi:hypothetical protein
MDEEVLMEEQKEALATAESSAARAVKLKAVVDELSSLAFVSVKAGDESAARDALKEKALAQEMLDRTTEKSIVHFRLASTLGTKIAEAQKRDQPRKASPSSPFSPSSSSSPSSSKKGSSLEDSLQETSERIKRKAAEDLNEALERVRSSTRQTEETLQEARARLREADRGTMTEVRKIMDKKRRGEYVSSEEVDWAFQMMEQML